MSVGALSGAIESFPNLETVRDALEISDYICLNDLFLFFLIPMRSHQNISALWKWEVALKK